MSSNNKDISKIISDGLDSFVYSTQNRVRWSDTIEYQCYDWLKKAYPDIAKEFIAVMEVSK